MERDGMATRDNFINIPTGFSFIFVSENYQ
jgi:hypothetical protein